MGSFTKVLSVDNATQAYVQQATGPDPAIAYSADYMRRVVGAVFPNQGVLSAGEMQIQPRSGTADWSFDVTPGIALVQRGAATNEKYMYYNRSTFNVPVTGLNTSPTQLRTHNVFLCIYDKVYPPSSVYGAKIYVAEDVGSGAGLPLDDPVGWLHLGTITIGPSQTAIQANNIAVSSPVASMVRPQTSLPPTTTSVVGQMAYLSTGTAPGVYEYISAGWRLVIPDSPYSRYTQTPNQAFENIGAYERVCFPATAITSGAFTPTGNGSVFTCNIPGRYQIGTYLRVGPSATGERHLVIGDTGSAATSSVCAMAGYPTNATGWFTATIQGERTFQVGNGFSVWFYQNTGSSSLISQSDYGPAWLNIRRVL